MAEIQAKNEVTRVKPAGYPASQPAEEPKETMPTSVNKSSEPTTLRGPPLSPCNKHLSIIKLKTCQMEQMVYVARSVSVAGIDADESRVDDVVVRGALFVGHDGHVGLTQHGADGTDTCSIH
jgi:hypothetical protein